MSSHGLQQAPNVAVAEGKGLQAIGVIVRKRDMIRHQHIGITNFVVHVKGFDEIDIPLVRIHFQEVVSMPANVSEMNIEYLLACAEISNYVKDLFPRIGKHLRDSALAEIKAVVGALLN